MADRDTDYKIQPPGRADPPRRPPAAHAVVLEGLEAEPRRWRGLLAVPAWLVSLAVHLAVLLIMAAYTVEPIRDALASLTIESSPAVPDEVDSMELSQVDIDVRELSEEAEMTPLAATPLEQLLSDTPPEMTLEPVAMGVGPIEVASPLASMVPGDLMAASMSEAMTAAMTGRSVAGREELLKKFGGNDATEKAVALGLKWLAAHQLPDGSWTFAHSVVCNGQCKEQSGMFPQARNAATGLALMAFLGAGQTHREGEYKEAVHKGLAFLLTQMRTGRVAGVAVGSWYDDPVPPKAGNGANASHIYRMYGHAIATTAACEAFGMTQDPKLGEAAQLGVNYIVAVQDPKGGGWRYDPLQPGDTSVVGWMMMALKSAYISGLVFPQETIRRTSRFLDYVQLDGGARYDYEKPGDRKPEEWALTACGALCRMYMGVPKEHPGLQAAVANIAKAGPSRGDSYLNYYGSQVLKQYGGEPWSAWNKKMQETLVTTQINTGHAAGSWTPEGHHDVMGGRLYTTCMSIMVLEVYYRYLPIYHEQAADEAFEL